jgi:1,2-dihydroxy-3-keto-5-methylthiopentene dioxygenase
MTLLTTWADTDPSVPVLRTDDPAQIEKELAEFGIRFDQWPVSPELPATATADDVMAAYREQVDSLVASEDFKVVDVVRLHPTGEPGWEELAAGARKKFLDEHTHDDDDEVRFFVEGSGIFYLHIGDRVHAVLCEAGDLLSVPRGTTHWFDMGTNPSFCAIRFFHEEEGWVGSFTETGISSQFPDYDTIVAGR